LAAGEHQPSAGEIVLVWIWNWESQILDADCVALFLGGFSIPCLSPVFSRSGKVSPSEAI